MRKIGLIALDLDGTLLDSQKHLSEGNRKALLRCANLGIQIVPATGRPVDGIPEIIRNLTGVNYAITTNGGVVVDLANGKKRLKCCTIPNQLALRILHVISQYHAMYDPYIEGRGITQPEFFEHMTEYGLSAVIQDMVRSTRDVVPNILHHLEACKKDVEKVNVFLGDLSKREPLRQALSDIPGITISSSMYNNLEINAKEATKGNALMWLADYLHIDREATMAFGDGENDLTMLNAAGIGVAMGNGEEAARKAADQITLTNDEDGVAAAIERLILTKTL